MTISSLLQMQLSTLSLFLSTPSTKTPAILLLIASFGSSLHHPVTTFFYIKVIGESAALSIGTLGFIQALGGTIGGPIVGWALDRYGPWIPIAITATACSCGCLWRGLANNLLGLQLGAILNGVGVNLWTVVLGHLVKSFPLKMRSDVMSGIGVQLAVVQIMGKALFPMIEYALKSVVGIRDDLLRYRMHMGFCTAFCFYGTVALFWDRNNIGIGRVSNEVNDAHMARSTGILKEKQSDVLDDIEDGATPDEDLLPFVTHHGHDTNTTINKVGAVEMVEKSTSNVTISSIKVEHENAGNNLSGPTTALTIAKYKNKQVMASTILSVALLLQSLSNTMLTVLWPLLAHDRFHVTAQTFGLLTFISSIISMGAMAIFPIVEKKIGRIKCAAGGFCVASMLGVMFCVCSFGIGSNVDILDRERILGVEEIAYHRNGLYSSMLKQNSSDLFPFFEDYMIEYDNATIRTNQRIELSESVDYETQTHSPYLWHAISAIAFQSSLAFLEPSLKSILSIVTSSIDSSSPEQSSRSSLGFTMGFMTTLANVGGMIGNIMGTWMYKISRDSDDVKQLSSRIFFDGGSLPFFVSAVLLGLSSLCIWRLDEPSHDHAKNETTQRLYFNQPSELENRPEILDDVESIQDGCCMRIREREIDHEMKCD